MSGREWKPGDVALVTMRSRADGREVSGGPAVAIRDNVGSWACGAATSRRLLDSDTLSARPLVVIDPEDREQVERLIRALSTGQPVIGLDPANRDMVDAAWLRHTQAALHSLIEPPKPAEPTGLGAVVEDVHGERWVRGPSHNSWRWLRADRPGCEGYDDIAAVRVLSEGVQS